MLGVQIESTKGQFLDYGILESTKGSLRLITPTFKGTILGGATLLLFSSAYCALLVLPFIFFHVPPITQWDQLPRGLFVTAIPAGFVLIVFLGLGWVRRVQTKFQKTSRGVKVMNVRIGNFRHEIAVQSEGESLVLTTTGLKGKLLRAIALSEQET